MNSEINRKGWLKVISGDISLYDGFLDLIDNAIDMVSSASRNNETFIGYEIKIQIIGNDLHISNNAEGMTSSTLRKAFLSYSKYNKEETIEKFASALQRSLYKLGKEFEIKTWQKEKQHGTGIVDRDAMEKGNFSIYTSRIDKKENGNEIIIFDLHKDLKNNLEEQSNLVKDLGLRYGKFIENDLKITYNDNNIVAINLKPENKVNQFKASIFKASRKKYNNLYEGWRVVIEVGGLPNNTKEEIDSDWDRARKNGGWYVFFNNKSVLLADKTEKTGWGYEGATRFHPQYNGFLGIVSIESDITDSLPFDSTRLNIRSEHEGYKKLVAELVKYNKQWASFTIKNNKRKEDNTKNELGYDEEEQPTFDNCLFPTEWGKPEGKYAARFSSAIAEGQRFENWQKCLLASISITRVTIDLALRHVIRALDEKQDFYQRGVGIQGLLGMYSSIEGLDSSEKKARTAITRAIKIFNKQLNAYMHEEFESPSVTEIEDIITKVHPFIYYATRLKY